MLPRILIALVISSGPLLSAAQALTCGRPSGCQFWMAAQDAGVSTALFFKDGHVIKAADIKVGDRLVARTPIYVRSAPAAFREPPLDVLGRDAAVGVEELRSLPLPTGGMQIWIRVGGSEPPFPNNPPTTRPTPAPPSTPLTTLTPEEKGRLLESRDIFYDNDGLIVHRTADGKPDGGDTAQREGWYWLGVCIRKQPNLGLDPWKPTRKLSFDQVLDLLEPRHDGVFYRHPKLAPWNNPRDKEFGFSRDQMVPLVAAMGICGGQDDRIRRLWDALPEDLLGKHSFNGNWRNFLGQDGPNCDDIKKRSCSPTADCSLKVDTRDCSLKVDQRDCSLKVDNRDCSQPHDERDCSTCVIPNIFTGGCSQRGNNPVCETEKATQNKIYEGAKIACETAKGTQNAAYASEKASCEEQKAGQNSAYAAEKTSCETQKATQNATYAGEKALCEAAKTGGEAACEGDKQLAYQTCRITNVHSGDIIGPATVNLFRRALNQDPMVPDLNNILPSTIIRSGSDGEWELLVNTHLRVGKTQGDHDDTGDDLNHIVMLLTAKLRFATLISDNATKEYAQQRAHSFGSFLGAYYTHYGDDISDVRNRIISGIASGWQTDASAPYGAVRWYHRPDVGANPALAVLYRPIIEKYIK